MSTTRMLVATVVLLGSAAGAMADTFYTVSTEPGAEALLTIGPATGLSSVAAGYAGPEIWGLAFDPNGTLFATDYNQLMTMDTTTGAVTTIGSIDGVFGSNALAFSPAGELFGVNGSDGLVSIDPTTGAGSAIAPQGSLGAYSIAGLTFDTSGTLFGVGTLDWNEGSEGIQRLFAIDTALGVATTVSILATPTDIAGISFDSHGTLYGVTNSPDVRLVSIALDTGVVSYIGPGLGVGTYSVHSLAIIPEPATMVLLGLGAVALIRKRK